MNTKKTEVKKDHKPNPKSAINNQWTNNNLKYSPDQREQKDGPGGN